MDTATCAVVQQGRGQPQRGEISGCIAFSGSKTRSIDITIVTRSVLKTLLMCGDLFHSSAGTLLGLSRGLMWAGGGIPAFLHSELTSTFDRDK